jgi:RHS repeat-associated protein
MTDRLGSVRLHATNGRSSYQPYGAEVAPTTSDQRTKFATYFRDSAGLDYAGQRYYSNVTGRFLTPDPADAGAADPTNPNSWNMYGYAGGDPVNFIDPDGLAPCSSSGFEYNGMMIGTVAYALALTKDVTALAETEYTEAGHSSGTNSSAEEDMIGEVVMNRWALVNGYSYLYPTARRPPLNVSAWGSPGGGIDSVTQNGQFAVWNGSSLTTSAQNNLNAALSSAFDSKLCNDLAWAIGSAISFISSPTVNLYYDKSTGLAPLAFNSGNLTIPSYMQQIGSFGDANVFYGAPIGDFSANLIPLPRPRPIRPPTPPGRPGRPRGGPIQVQ